MKKILSFVMLIVFIVFSVFAVGCDPVTFYFDVDVYGIQVEKIELRYSELNGNPKIIKISDGVVPELHLNETYLVESLDVDKNMDFCNDLASIPYYDFYNYCVNKPFGYMLVMYLSNGNHIVLSWTLYGKRGYLIFAEFSADDEFIQCIGQPGDRRKYEILLAKYFSSYPYEFEE